MDQLLELNLDLCRKLLLIKNCILDYVQNRRELYELISLTNHLCFLPSSLLRTYSTGCFSKCNGQILIVLVQIKKKQIGTCYKFVLIFTKILSIRITLLKSLKYLNVSILNITKYFFSTN